MHACAHTHYMTEIHYKYAYIHTYIHIYIGLQMAFVLQRGSNCHFDLYSVTSFLTNTPFSLLLLHLNIISYHLFSFRKSVQDYIVHMDMEIIIFVGIKMKAVCSYKMLKWIVTTCYKYPPNVQYLKSDKCYIHSIRKLMENLRLSEWYCWRLKSAGTWCCHSDSSFHSYSGSRHKVNKPEVLGSTYQHKKLST